LSNDDDQLCYTQFSTSDNDIHQLRCTTERQLTVKKLTITQKHNNHNNNNKNNQAESKYKHLLTFRVRRYEAIAMKPVHRLQIRPIVHN